MKAFNSPSDVAILMDAIVESGLEKETKVKLMLLGNTGCGKSSLTEALKLP
jgi:predicted GTPase